MRLRKGPETDPCWSLQEAFNIDFMLSGTTYWLQLVRKFWNHSRTVFKDGAILCQRLLWSRMSNALHSWVTKYCMCFLQFMLFEDLIESPIKSIMLKQRCWPSSLLLHPDLLRLILYPGTAFTKIRLAIISTSDSLPVIYRPLQILLPSFHLGNKWSHKPIN